MVESRKRKIKELTDEFEGDKILRDGIEELVKEEIEKIEKDILNQYDKIAMIISFANLISLIAFSEITKRVIHKWKR